MGKKSELDDLRARLATLEAEVDRLRGQAVATRTTAAPAAALAPTPAATGRGRAEVRTAGPAPEAVREEQTGQPQSITGIADALGIMVSGRVPGRVPGRAEEPTQVLRARAEAPESRTLPLPAHGQFLESLLEGRPALQK
ncbi:hypothetical protein ACFVXG_35665 [Kitasatospora sp. NPDC058162]|uniref:hypothetical protein n=1 Tax=Kitasatospora sp. NPDC058162 TaxID=3346362 RepID=UPI0036DB8D70